MLEQIAEGQSWKALLEGYPELTREDIQVTKFCARTCLENLTERISIRCLVS